MSRRSSKTSTEATWRQDPPGAVSTPATGSARGSTTGSARGSLASTRQSGGSSARSARSPAHTSSSLQGDPPPTTSPTSPSARQDPASPSPSGSQAVRRKSSSSGTGGSGTPAARRTTAAAAEPQRPLSPVSRSHLDAFLDDLNLSDGVLTRASVARLIEEEAEDARLASEGLGAAPPHFPLSESLRYNQRNMRAVPVGDSALFLGEGEKPSNLSPAEVAAMMHRLQHGVSMAAPPDQLFKFLFPNASKPSVSASHSAAADPDSGRAATGGSQEAGAVNDNTLHSDGFCPIVCFGGGYPDSEGAQPLLQLKGSTPPAWFPGYFVALPETGGALSVKHSLTEVMHAAYMAARPCKIPAEGRFVY